MLKAIRPAALFAVVLLAACGGGAAPSSAPAASVAAPASAAVNPTSAAAGASTAASAKPATSGSAASAKPAASGSAAGSAAAAGSGQIKAAFGVLSVASTPMWAAQDEGLFKKEGLNVELSSLESAALIQAIVAGSVAMGTGSTTNTVNGVAQGADIRSVAAVTQTSSLMLISKPDVNSLNDLKGKAIAVTQPLSSSDFITRLVLQKNGLVYNKDVNILTAGTTNGQVAAFESGQVAAITGPIDVVNGLPAGSYKILVNIPEQHYAFSEQSLIVNGAFARAQPQAVASFINAFYQGSLLMLKDYDTYTKVAKAHLKGITDQALKAGHDNYESIWSTPANPRVTPESVQTIIDLLGEQNAKVKALKYEDVVDNSYIERLKAQGAFTNGGCQGC
ncbi:MAG TPA: ABC transporter substrate-binding protein [Chloroflexota bacterium]|nr:ABC transporter substrate-binding protein [Chloroflexota bacterium]